MKWDDCEEGEKKGRRRGEEVERRWRGGEERVEMIKEVEWVAVGRALVEGGGKVILYRSKVVVWWW